MSSTPRPNLPPRPGAELAEIIGDAAEELPELVSGVSLDSRRVLAGDLYAALPGFHTHGARFAEMAISSGAVAILTDAEGARIIGQVPIPVLVVEDPRSRLGEVSAWVYGRPADDLLLFGITGTNGKTTTAYLLDAALRAAGHLTGVIGTVAIQVGDEVMTSTRTTPEAPDLHALLAVMRERGVTAVTMEVSSHALSLGRVDGVMFDVATFTNFTQDHLDFHETMQEYFRAKAELFSPRRARRGVICTDDEWGEQLVGLVQLPVTTFGLRDRADAGPDWLAVDLRVQPAGGTRFTARHRRTDADVSAGVALPGSFNVANALGALASAAAAGLSPIASAAAIADCAGVPGRMESIVAGQPFLAIVDYAHTPDAVERVIAAARNATTGRIITVLGAGGDRDREKRPQMGAVAAAGSDILVITDDNPRSEPPSLIRAAIMEGVRQVDPTHRARTIVVGERRAAIEQAVALAAQGDAILLLGKGHEQGQEVAGEVIPFDDRAEVRRAIEARRA